VSGSTASQSSLTFTPGAKLKVTLGWNLVWWHRPADTFYAPPLRPILVTGSNDRFVGQQVSAGVTWQATRGVVLETSFVSFEPGDALCRAGGRSGDFLAVSAGLRF
jgi:hypothetical protein